MDKIEDFFDIDLADKDEYGYISFMLTSKRNKKIQMFVMVNQSKGDDGSFTTVSGECTAVRINPSDDGMSGYPSMYFKAIENEDEPFCTVKRGKHHRMMK